MSKPPSRPKQPRTRTLAAEERALWRAVTRSVAPLHPHAAYDVPDEPAPTASREHGLVSAPQHPRTKRQSSAPPPLAPLDRRLKQRLSRGVAALDGRIDLHGLTQNEAHRALTRFLVRAQASGARNVLVITGKGGMEGHRDGFAERGVLRRQVPLWLKLPELRGVVLGFEAAHANHGGEGALYVRLRRANRP